MNLNLTEKLSKFHIWMFNILTILMFRFHTGLGDKNTYFVFCLKFRRLYVDHLMTTFFQTFILWLLAYLTLFIPIENLNERFMGAVTALLVLASLLGSMENNLPKSSQMNFIDYWFLWYIINIFFIISSFKCLSATIFN